MILGMRSLRVFHQLSFAHALTRGASLVAASPRPNAAAPGGAGGPRRGGRAAAEVRRLRGGNGRFRLETPELSQPQRRADALYLPSTFVQVDPFPVSA